ncbi:MAG TPA: hypothetical protein VMK12_29735, partial [Anaeromyxobacteraceae bacterium]|nr:hypothetical protein [Anaeromyxobacteraceae bacterium]
MRDAPALSGLVLVGGDGRPSSAFVTLPDVIATNAAAEICCEACRGGAPESNLGTSAIGLDENRSSGLSCGRGAPSWCLERSLLGARYPSVELQLKDPQRLPQRTGASSKGGTTP